MTEQLLSSSWYRVAGLRPSAGRIPSFNPSAAAERPLSGQVLSAQGPLARRVGDLRLRVLWPDGPGSPGEDPNQRATVLLARIDEEARRAGSVRCSHCGEESPANFDLCWKCGASLARA